MKRDIEEALQQSVLQSSSLLDYTCINRLNFTTDEMAIRYHVNGIIFDDTMYNTRTANLDHIDTSRAACSVHVPDQTTILARLLRSSLRQQDARHKTQEDDSSRILAARQDEFRDGGGRRKRRGRSTRHKRGRSWPTSCKATEGVLDDDASATTSPWLAVVESKASSGAPARPPGWAVCSWNTRRSERVGLVHRLASAMAALRLLMVDLQLVRDAPDSFGAEC